MVARRAVVLVEGELSELPTTDTLQGVGGGSLVWISATLNLAAGRGVFEHYQTITDAAVLPASVIQIKLSPVSANDENDPELLGLEEIVATPGTGQFDVVATFTELHSGPIKVQYQVS